MMSMLAEMRVEVADETPPSSSRFDDQSPVSPGEASESPIRPLIGGLKEEKGERFTELDNAATLKQQQLPQRPDVLTSGESRTAAAFAEPGRRSMVDSPRIVWRDPQWVSHFGFAAPGADAASYVAENSFRGHMRWVRWRGGGMGLAAPVAEAESSRESRKRAIHDRRTRKSGWIEAVRMRQTPVQAYGGMSRWHARHPP